MNTEDLDLLREVARRGSFAAAARVLGLDPSSVSRTIAGLERDLGFRLFQRTTRRLSLTEAGDVYLARVDPLIDALAEARSEAEAASSGPRGTLRLTASVTFGQRLLLPLLPGFRAAYPDLALDCLFTDETLDLVGERIDLAIRLAPAIEGDLIAAKLMDTRYRVVASPDYLAAAPPITTPADLGTHPCLLFALRSYRTAWRFRAPDGTEERVAISGNLVLSPAGSLHQAALSGFGPALLPDWLIDADMADGRLTDLFPQHEVAATSFDTAAFLVYPSRSHLPAKVRVMVDHLRAHLPRPRG
ncbi:MAG: LysR family transcriptional regulator [Pseudomonadota bacterium]